MSWLGFSHPGKVIYQLMQEHGQTWSCPFRGRRFQRRTCRKTPGSQDLCDIKSAQCTDHGVLPDCSQCFPIYNWPENLQRVSALGDIWRGMNTQLFWVGEVSAARLSLECEGWLGAFPPTPSEVLGARLKPPAWTAAWKPPVSWGKWCHASRAQKMWQPPQLGSVNCRASALPSLASRTRTRSTVCTAQSLLKNLLHTEPWEVTVLLSIFL